MCIKLLWYYDLLRLTITISQVSNRFITDLPISFASNAKNNVIKSIEKHLYIYC